MQKVDQNLQHKSNSINQSFCKRCFDIVFSVLLFLFVFSWLFPIIYILIKLTSNGDAFFIQNRIGLNGAIFSCYKFRTLPQRAINEAETFVTSENLPATSIGKWLRKLNFDELPQFINVLKGDMSIVGPRPHAIAYHNKYAEYIEHIDTRLLVKPGITGLAQIKGYRGDVADEALNKQKTIKRIELDIDYINQWSFGYDVKIALLTFLQIAGIGGR